MTQHLSDEELQLINDQNAALPQQRQHLQGCWYCTQRLQEYRVIAGLLTSAKPAPEIPAGFAENTTELILQREAQPADKGDFIAAAMIGVMILAGIAYAFTNLSLEKTVWLQWPAAVESHRFVETAIEAINQIAGYLIHESGWAMYGIGAVIILTVIVEMIFTSLANKTTKFN
jgi:hypothetical protein